MPLDIKGFVTPEQDFSELQKLGTQFAAQKKAEAKEAQKTKDTVTLSMLKMADPTKYLSGAPSDPNVIEGFGDVFSKTMNALSENPKWSKSQLEMYMYPLVNELAQKAYTSKNIFNAVTKDIQNYDKSFYDIPTLKDRVIKKIYFNEDGTKKPLEQISYDPNVLNSVIADEGYDIVKSKGITDAIKAAKPIEENVKTTTRDKSGKLVETYTKVSRRPWEIADTTTGEIVPSYELATDDGNPILHNGEQVKVVPDDIYENFINSGDPARDWVTSQVKKHIDEYSKAATSPEEAKIDINSPQAKLVGKAILHDLLYQNRSGKQFTGTKELYKMPSAPRYGGRGGAGGGMDIKDIWTDLNKSLDIGQQRLEQGEFGEERKGGRYNQPMNELTPEVQTTLIKLANKTGKKYTSSDLYLRKNNQGAIELRNIEDNSLVMPIDYTGLNIAAKQPGASEERGVVEVGKKKQGVVGKAVGKIIQKVKKAITPKSNDNPLGLDL